MPGHKGNTLKTASPNGCSTKMHFELSRIDSDEDRIAALNRGKLPASTRARIALAVAEINGYSYCLSAHTYLGRNLAKDR